MGRGKAAKHIRLQSRFSHAKKVAHVKHISKHALAHKWENPSMLKGLAVKNGFSPAQTEKHKEVYRAEGIPISN